MRTIAELAAALRSRTLSSVELAQQALDCVAAAQPHLNAFITVDEPGALASARAADAALARGDAAALTGIPLAHKDVLMTQGLRTTCGSRMAGTDPSVDPLSTTMSSRSTVDAVWSTERMHAAVASLVL